MCLRVLHVHWSNIRNTLSYIRILLTALLYMSAHEEHYGGFEMYS